jgi:hypothetical protein
LKTIVCRHISARCRIKAKRFLKRVQMLGRAVVADSTSYVFSAPPLAWADGLSREVYGMLGMPIDALDRGEVVNRVTSAARAGRHLLLYTPNVNFLVVSLRDLVFR